MSTQATSLLGTRDRFFFAQVDGKDTLFVLHADHSICIAPASQSITVVESTETVLAEVCGLAA